MAASGDAYEVERLDRDEPEALEALNGEIEDQGEAEPDEASGVIVNASGITSHVLQCGRSSSISKSTFKPPHTTAAVWTRSAFFNRQGARIALSAWFNTGPGNPYKTKPFHWTCNLPDVGRALVVWNMDGSKWDSWDDC